MWFKMYAVFCTIAFLCTQLTKVSPTAIARKTAELFAFFLLAYSTLMYMYIVTDVL